jgi:hypothetical protein
VKFKKGEFVRLPSGARGIVLHAFVAKVYGLPDVDRYTVRMDDGFTWEFSEQELLR